MRVCGGLNDRNFPGRGEGSNKPGSVCDAGAASKATKRESLSTCILLIHKGGTKPASLSSSIYYTQGAEKKVFQAYETVANIFHPQFDDKIMKLIKMTVIEKKKITLFFYKIQSNRRVMYTT